MPTHKGTINRRIGELEGQESQMEKYLFQNTLKLRAEVNTVRIMKLTLQKCKKEVLFLPTPPAFVKSI